MKIYGIKSDSIQDRNIKTQHIDKDIKPVTASKKFNLDNKINIRDFADIATKIKQSEELTAEQIQSLRDELKNSPVTSELLANSMISYVKANEWARGV